MFGMPAGFVNGNMFLGVFANGVVLRLSKESRLELESEQGMGPFEPRPGSPWKEYLHATRERGSRPLLERDRIAPWLRTLAKHHHIDWVRKDRGSA